MKKVYEQLGRKKIVVVSLFSGMDLFLLGMTKAGMTPGYAIERNFYATLMHRHKYKHRDGTPVMEAHVEIDKETYEYMKKHTDSKGHKDMEDEVGVVDGKYYRTKLIQEINGYDIRRAIEERFGKDIVIIVIGGPPCQGYTRNNSNNFKNQYDERNNLVFEFLRILNEISVGEGNVIGCMEQVPDFGPGRYMDIYNTFWKKVEQEMPFIMHEKEMNSLHYGGRQNRTRKVFLLPHKSLNIDPVFPVPSIDSGLRVKDFLDIDEFVMGQYDRLVRNGDHFMQTVTRGAPEIFYKNRVARKPTVDELLKCFGTSLIEYPIPEGIAFTELRLAIGNAVCVEVAYALAIAIIRDMLKMKYDGDGYFIPIDPIPPSLPDTDTGATDVTAETTDMGVAVPVEAVGDVHDTLSVEIDSSVSAIPDTGVVASTVTDKLPVNKAPQATSPKELSVKRQLNLTAQGYVLWRGPSRLNGEDIVAILTLQSSNAKTGDMAQLWILPAPVNPLEASKSGEDESVCGNCKLRRGQGGACYVRLEESPLTVWKAWRSGLYPDLPLIFFNQLAGLSIRFGAYGDPAALPVNILKTLQKYAANYTGYTHQWKGGRNTELQPFCMASVDNEEEQSQAEAAGWRTYRVTQPTDSLMANEIMCPHITNGVQCVKCQLCKGTSSRAKNIAVPVHGSHKGRFNSIADTGAGNSSIMAVDGSALTPNKPTIITSTSLLEMDFPSLYLAEPWNSFLGEPATNFHCILHGMAGKGKSTFAIQFAHYLAKNHGRVLYVSAEEGFSKTLREKVVGNGMGSDAMDVSNFRNFEDLKGGIEPDTYRFIFLDSLGTMRINAGMLRELRLRHKEAAFITISHNTKDGKMRGSYELVHDCDIAIDVVNGVAITTKNRFKETGLAYDIFSHLPQQETGR